MGAISKVLESISGKYKDLYPEIEQYLEEPLKLTLTQAGASSVEDGLVCISELLYNQDTISSRMWYFYVRIVESYLKNEGILEDFLP